MRRQPQQDQNKIHLRRYNNLALRFLQLGIQLLIGQILSQVGINNKNCEDGLLTIIFFVSILLIIMNIIFLLLIFIRRTYIKNVYYFFLGIQIIVAGVVMVLGLSSTAKGTTCANLKIFNQFVGIQSLIALFLAIYVLCAPFNLAQRYANAPGNGTWIFLFLTRSWGPYSPYFLAIGIIMLLITVSTAILNVLSLIIGMTKKFRNVMRFQWLFSIFLLILCTILGFISYVKNLRGYQYNDIMARKLSQIFVGVNIVDIIFWLWGLFSVKDQFGLTMKEGLDTQQYSDELENDLDQIEDNDLSQR